MYVKATNNTIDQYPYTIGNLRYDNPNVSFPKVLSEETLNEYNVYTVAVEDTPAYDEATQKLVVATEPVLVDGVWTITKSVVDKTQQELDDELAARRAAMRCTPLQGLLALDNAGLASAYETWANDAGRTFSEKAFVNKANVWMRSDTTLQSAATALGLSDTDLDNLFDAAVQL